MLLVFGLFLSLAADAQPRCEQLRQRIYQITSTEAAQVPDSLRAVLALTDSVRDCEGETTTEREMWLLTADMYALDGLDRYEEASTVVGHFFDVYFDRASDYYKARFYLWRIHLKALSGDGTSMVKDYAEAQQYADALDRINRAWLHINGAHSYMQIAEYEAALRLTEQALARIGEPETYDERRTAARALLLAAESQLRLGTASEQIEEKISSAADLYSALGDTSKVAVATALLSMTYAAAGDTSRAVFEMSEAIELAQQAGDLRSQLYIRWKQGRLLCEWGDFEAAEQTLHVALRASERNQEFTLRLAYELAMLFEARDHLDRAARYYQAVIDAPRPSGLVAALEAEIKQQRAQSRLLLIENGRSQRRFYFALSALFVVLFGGVALFVFLQKRIPQPTGQPAGISIAQKKSNGDFVPRKLTTGLTLEELEKRFQEALGQTKFALRLAWIYAVLLDIELILLYITDDYLARKVETYSIGHNAELFKCVAAIEEARTGEIFKGNPENTLGTHLRAEFDKRGWHWPKHQVVWKRHFMEHHVEMLFEREDEGDEDPTPRDE